MTFERVASLIALVTVSALIGTAVYLLLNPPIPTFEADASLSATDRHFLHMRTDISAINDPDGAEFERRGSRSH
jgi:uncharacterized protein involved in exopolysaccharide biosynthesis